MTNFPYLLYLAHKILFPQTANIFIAFRKINTLEVDGILFSSDTTNPYVSREYSPFFFSAWQHRHSNVAMFTIIGWKWHFSRCWKGNMESIKHSYYYHLEWLTIFEFFTKHFFPPKCLRHACPKYVFWIISNVINWKESSRDLPARWLSQRRYKWIELEQWGKRATRANGISFVMRVTWKGNTRLFASPSRSCQLNLMAGISNSSANTKRPSGSQCMHPIWYRFFFLFNTNTDDVSDKYIFPLSCIYAYSSVRGGRHPHIHARTPTT